MQTAILAALAVLINFVGKILKLSWPTSPTHGQFLIYELQLLLQFLLSFQTQQQGQQQLQPQRPQQLQQLRQLQQ